jgi:ribosomal protein S18 acetylase RimI-like enzyme
MKNYNILGTKEMSIDASQIVMFLEQQLQQYGSVQYMLVTGPKYEIIEGQCYGRYYYDKVPTNDRDEICIMSQVCGIKFWLTDDEIHIDVIEVKPKYRRQGIGSKILSIFKTVALFTNRKITLRAEPIDLHEAMGKEAGVKYGPKLYKRFAVAIDKRLDALGLFYSNNGFEMAPGIGLNFVYKPSTSQLEAIEALKQNLTQYV